MPAARRPSSSPGTARSLRNAYRPPAAGRCLPTWFPTVSFVPLAPLSGKAGARRLTALFASTPLVALLRGAGVASSGGGGGTWCPRQLTADEAAVRDAIAEIVRTNPAPITHASNFEVGIDSLRASHCRKALLHAHSAAAPPAAGRCTSTTSSSGSPRTPAPSMPAGYDCRQRDLAHVLLPAGRLGRLRLGGPRPQQRQ